MMACVESSYGVSKSTPVLGTDKWYQRLDRDNAFTWQAARGQIPIPYGGGIVAEAETVPGEITVTGAFSFRLWGGVQTTTLLKWAIQQINSGRTLPWVTTDAAGVMPVGDSPSLSFYDAYLKEDQINYNRKALRGAKCLTWELAGSDTGEGRVWNLSGTFVAKTVDGNPWSGSADPLAAELPIPGESDYPVNPYVFTHLATATGTLKLGKTGDPQPHDERKDSIQSVTFRGTNTYVQKRYASDFLVLCNYRGRSVAGDFVVRLKDTPDDRDRWQRLTPMTVQMILDPGFSGSSILNLSLGTNNLIRPWDPTLAGNGDFTQRLSLQNRWDKTTGTDIALTITTNP
jgi:hypothetical protein